MYRPIVGGVLLAVGVVSLVATIFIAMSGAFIGMCLCCTQGVVLLGLSIIYGALSVSVGKVPLELCEIGFEYLEEE